MKMRFWQKTYILTLIIFLFFLNVGVLSLAMYTYRTSAAAEEESAKALQSYIASSFERDYNLLPYYEKDKEAVCLMSVYGNHYGGRVFLIEFKEGENTVYSNFAEGFGVNANSITHRDIRDRLHIIISTEVCYGKYSFALAKDVEHLNDKYRAVMVTYITITLVVSVMLAVILFAVLRKLSAPLDGLKSVTEKIGKGDFTVRAEMRGNDEFTLLAGSFNTMLEKIGVQMQSLEAEAEKKQMLVDNMAHELRTPLTSIYGYAELLEKAILSDEDKIIAARYIMAESKRLEKISEILLDEAYIRGNAPSMTSVDLSEIIKNVKNSLDYKADSIGVRIITDLPEKGQAINGNETLLSMLFYNLTENAVKACSEGGEVLLSVDGLKVYVKDNGKGMTEEQLLHITEPFYRTDKSRARSEGGVGLGLSLCKRIADAHGIVMEFRSSPGIGTTVILNFTT